jgi:hypothetical protein
MSSDAAAAAREYSVFDRRSAQFYVLPASMHGLASRFLLPRTLSVAPGCPNRWALQLDHALHAFGTRPRSSVPEGPWLTEDTRAVLDRGRSVCFVQHPSTMWYFADALRDAVGASSASAAVPFESETAARRYLDTHWNEAIRRRLGTAAPPEGIPTEVARATRLALLVEWLATENGKVA